MWLDDCRIPFVDDDIPSGGYGKATIGYGNEYEYKGGAGKTEQQGRFTPNLLVCDDLLNDGVITKSGFNPKAKIKQYGGGNFGGGKTNDNGIDYGDKGSNSRYYDLDLWFDKMLERL